VRQDGILAASSDEHDETRRPEKFFRAAFHRRARRVTPKSVADADGLNQPRDVTDEKNGGARRWPGARGRLRREEPYFRR